MLKQTPHAYTARLATLRRRVGAAPIRCTDNGTLNNLLWYAGMEQRSRADLLRVIAACFYPVSIITLD